MIFHRLIDAFLLAILLAAGASAQEGRATGGIKGKVRAEGGTAAGITIIARQGEREVARGVTDRKGEFVIARLAPGIYGLTFRKPGLSVATIENVEVRAGKVRSLGDSLVLTVDEGSIAFVRGSVFNVEGRSVPGARVEIARLAADGTTKKINGRMTDESGIFVFRLVPDAAQYRITVKADGAEPATKDIEVDGAARYNISLTLQPTAK